MYGIVLCSLFLCLLTIFLTQSERYLLGSFFMPQYSSLSWSRNTRFPKASRAFSPNTALEGKSECSCPPCPDVANRNLSTTGSAQKRFPDALIIGVRKGGTRALIDFLSVHPKVKHASQEVHFFDKPEHYKLGINSYLSMLPAVSKEELLIEKTPAYFVSPKAPELIHTIQPDVKLLLIVRNPIDRVVSDYLQIEEKRRSARKRIQSLREVLYVVREDLPPAIDTRTTFVQTSMYCIHMANWLKNFPRDQILVLDGDRFTKNPYDTMKAVEQFLHLNAYFRHDHFVYNASKGFYCVQCGQEAETCLGEEKGREHPSIDKNIVEDLKLVFANCTKRFEEQTGMTFNWNS